MKSNQITLYKKITSINISKVSLAKPCYLQLLVLIPLDFTNGGSTIFH